jgi:hypothetical protein
MPPGGAPAGAPDKAGIMGSAPGRGMGAGGPPAGAGGMMAQMGPMMKAMGTPPSKELYPSLMEMPDLPPEKRGEVERQAQDRMQEGLGLLSMGLQQLTASTANDNYGAMQDASAQMRQGIARFESGLAAHRALAEGRAPRNVALEWFKRDMSLVPLIGNEATQGARGLSIFHLFTMALLVAFAFAMLTMYFFKMRRAAALFGRIDPDKGTPPPGSSPPLGGGPGPSAGKPALTRGSP